MILQKLEKLGPREKLGLAIATILVSALLADGLVIKTVANVFKELDADIENEQNGLAYNRRLEEGQPGVSAKYQAVKDLLGEAPSSAEAIDEMKGQIDELARRAGLDIVSMAHREPRKRNFCVEHSVEVGEFEGDLAKMLRFLHELRKLPGMLRVAQLSVTPDKSRGLLKGSMLITKVMILSEQQGSME